MSMLRDLDPVFESIVEDDEFWAEGDFHPLPADWADVNDPEGFGPIAGHTDRFDNDGAGPVNESGDRIDWAYLLGF